MLKKNLLQGLTFATLLIANPVQAINLGFNPVSQTVNLGNTLTVDVVISGLGNQSSPSLGTYDITINFPPERLAFSGITFGSQLSLSTISDKESVSDLNQINLAEVSNDDPTVLRDSQAPSFILATLEFNTVSAGDGTLSFLNLLPNFPLYLGDENGTELSGYVIEQGKFTILGNSSPSVPEPSSILGIIGIGFVLLGYKN